MSFQNFMNKIRYLDNLFLKWMMRHVYFMFFQLVLLAIFLFWFINVFRVIEINFQATQNSLFEQTLVIHSINITIIVFLLLLNSFWLLYIFNGIQRLGNLIKDLNYHLLRSKGKQ